MNAPDQAAAVLAKAKAGGARAAELAALRRRLRQLGERQAGLLPSEVLQPLADLPRLEELPEPPTGQAREVLDQLVVVKLNGGLGTSMGLAGPKSLLEVKPSTSFLDVLAAQVLALRTRHGARLSLVPMNSVATRSPSLDVLRRYDGLRIPGLPLDFLQGREPKIRADDLQPVQWPADPELEWCPPGHGDIYIALAASGTLDALLGAGMRYAFVSNSDNLGAVADVRIDLRAIKDLQAADPAAPELPLIVNRKTVDPRDPDSTPVIQLETAMGAAIGSIPDAQAVHVPRTRFAPVKTTEDLLVVRSDAYELTSDGQLRPSFDGSGPLVTLDQDFYELLPGFERLFPDGAPSLRRCHRFEVQGDVTFGARVVAVGDVRVTGPRHVPDREVLGG